MNVIGVCVFLKDFVCVNGTPKLKAFHEAMHRGFPLSPSFSCLRGGVKGGGRERLH